MRIILIVLFVSITVLAVPRQSIRKTKSINIKILKIINSNRLSNRNKQTLIKRYGIKGLKELRQIFNSESISFKNRWKALMLYARLGGKKRSFPGLVEALSDRQWFIRSASAKALGYMKEKRAVPYLLSTLKDRSLIVRTSAVDALGQIKSKSSVGYLKKALFDPINFHKGKGLWIRRHIVEAIIKIRGPASISMLLSLLDDNDKSVIKTSVTALSKLTGVSYKGIPIEEQVSKWKYYKKNRNKGSSSNVSVQFIKK